MNTSTLPNTCIDTFETDGHSVGMYRVWPAFGGMYIVTARNGHEIARTQHDSEADARRDFDGWVDAFCAEAEYRDAAETTAGLLTF